MPECNIDAAGKYIYMNDLIALESADERNPALSCGCLNCAASRLHSRLSWSAGGATCATTRTEDSLVTSCKV